MPLSRPRASQVEGRASQHLVVGARAAGAVSSEGAVEVPHGLYFLWEGVNQVLTRGAM